MSGSAHWSEKLLESPDVCCEEALFLQHCMITLITSVNISTIMITPVITAIILSGLLEVLLCYSIYSYYYYYCCCKHY